MFEYLGWRVACERAQLIRPEAEVSKQNDQTKTPGELSSLKFRDLWPPPWFCWMLQIRQLPLSLPLSLCQREVESHFCVFLKTQLDREDPHSAVMVPPAAGHIFHPQRENQNVGVQTDPFQKNILLFKSKFLQTDGSSSGSRALRMHRLHLCGGAGSSSEAFSREQVVRCCG